MSRGSSESELCYLQAEGETYNMRNQEKIRAALQPVVDAGELAGAATLVWREGDAEAMSTCVGWRDFEAKSPISRETIFRIASMTKPITSVAALMLVDEGRIDLNEPITRYAQEFSRMQVLRSPNAPLNETDAAERPITFDDLLTHRAGLTYADFHQGPIAQAYREVLGGDIDSDVQPDEWIAGLARLPLIAQPGTVMTYGRATDLLGLLVARIEGKPLGAEGHKLRRSPREVGTQSRGLRFRRIRSSDSAGHLERRSNRRTAGEYGLRVGWGRTVVHSR